MTKVKDMKERGYPDKELERQNISVLGRISLATRIALLYLFLITAAEILTTIIEPRAGIFLYGLILIILIIHTALENRPLIRGFLSTLALISLIRLINLAMPLQKFPQIYWYILVGIPLFFAALFVARFAHLNRKMVGLTLGNLPIQALIGLIGIGFGYVEYLILHPSPLVTQLRLELLWFPALILLIFTGFLEEIIFRGMLQYTSTRVLRSYGIVYTAIVFTVLHIGYHNWLDLLFVFIVAVIFGWFVHRTGSIMGVSVAHGLINICIFLVFPFLLGII